MEVLTSNEVVVRLDPKNNEMKLKKMDINKKTLDTDEKKIKKFFLIGQVTKMVQYYYMSQTVTKKISKRQ